MRSFRNAFVNAIRSRTLDPFLNIEIATTPPIYLTTMTDGMDVGGKSYQPVGITDYELPSVSAFPQRSPMRLHLEGYGDYRSLLSAIGSDIVVHVGTASDLTGFDRMYPGVLADAKEVIDFEQESRLMVLTIDTMFFDLDATNRRHTLPEHQRRHNTADTCFDEVYDNVLRVEKFWGRGV